MVVMIFMIKYEYHDVFHVPDVQQQENLAGVNQKNIEQQKTALSIIAEKNFLLSLVVIGINHY